MIDYVRVRNRLLKKLIDLSEGEDAVALGWLALIAFRSETELLQRIIPLLRRFLENEPFLYDRNAGALGAAFWLAQNGILMLPEQFEQRYEQLLMHALQKKELRTACVLTDASLIYLIAHAFPERLKDSLVAFLRKEIKGLPYRRIIYTESLRLHDPQVKSLEFELDRLDTQDLIAYSWQHARNGHLNQALFKRTLDVAGTWLPLAPHGPVLHPFLQSMLLETILIYMKQVVVEM